MDPSTQATKPIFFDLYFLYSLILRFFSQVSSQFQVLDFIRLCCGSTLKIRVLYKVYTSKFKMFKIYKWKGI